MRASVLRGGVMALRDDVPEPVPERGQVLVRVLACGVCGGDLHFAEHGPRLARLAGELERVPTLTDGLDPTADVFMGHEFVAEVVEAGPGTDAPPPGTVVTSMPVHRTPNGVEPRLYSNHAPGGYAELMLLSASLLVPVPNGLDPRLAALTEPMAVGLHAVNSAGPGEGAVVIGCGPAGLSVIAALKATGTGPVIASDFSPARRALALRMGADLVVDPAESGVFDAWTGTGAPVVYEAVGVPGVLNDILKRTPARSRVVVVGGCMEPDVVVPYFGIAKELSLRFVQAYTPEEFTESLRRIADGEVDVAPMITGEVGLADVGRAFADLRDPDRHCKILVRPDLAR